MYGSPILFRNQNLLPYHNEKSLLRSFLRRHDLKTRYLAPDTLEFELSKLLDRSQLKRDFSHQSKLG